MVPILLQRRTKSNYMLDLFLLLSWWLPVAFVTVRILSVHNGLPRGPCCSAWLLNQSAFVHLWVATGRKKVTPPLPQAWPLQEILQELWISSPPPPFCPIKETGIQIDTDKRVILRHQSAIFLVSWLSE